MICDHPECTGRHSGRVEGLCPAALERKREYDRKRGANMTPEQRERKRATNRRWWRTKAEREGRTYTPRDTRPLEVRFWEQVEGRENRFQCWEWAGTINSDGYGWFGSTAAYRTAWELANGPLPKDMTLDHLCRWRRCVNPLHLDLVTPEENARRAQVFRLREVTKRPVYVAVDEKLWGFLWQDLRMYASLSEIRGLGRDD